MNQGKNIKNIYPVFIVWAKAKTRALEICRKYNAKMISLSCPIPYIVRYPLFFFITLFKLFKYSPSVIFCQVPPIFTAFAVYIYKVLYGKGKFLIDVHSAELIGKKWKLLEPLRRFVFKRASVVTLHNVDNYQRIRHWKGNFVILYDKIPSVPEGIPKRFCNKDYKEVIFISSFASSEPYLEEIEVAKLMEREKEWIFVFTGNPSKIQKKILPQNIILSGFVPYDEYWSILKGADVIVSLDKRDSVVTSGVWEGLALEKPVVTNDCDLLKNLFGDAFVYTSLLSLEIIRNVKRAYKELKILEIKVGDKKQELLSLWENSFEVIMKDLIGR